MAPIKIVYGSLLALLVVANVVYWGDPWFWRRYVMLFDPTPAELLKPFELVE